MKENAPLLITLAVMLLVIAAILLPDYFACHPIAIIRTAREAQVEALEAADLHRYVQGPVRSITIESNALTMFVDDAPKTEIHKVFDAVADTWKYSYATRHHLTIDSIPCLRLTIYHLGSHESETFESHDSVLSLFENSRHF